MRQTVQERVGGRVIRLAGRTQDRSHRRENHEEIERQIRGERVEIPRSENFGSQNPAEVFRVEVEEQVVVQHSRGMNHSAERRHRVSNFGQRAGQIAFVRNVGLDRRDGGALGRQIGGDFFAGGGSSTAAEENQVPRALFHEPARDFEPQASVASRDQIRRIGAWGRGPIRAILGFGEGKRKHDLADIFAPGHVTEGVGGVLDGENIVRERLEAALLEHRHQLEEQRAEQGGPLAADAVQVEGKIRKIIAKREQAQRLVLIDIRLADFDETAMRRRGSKGCG